MSKAAEMLEIAKAPGSKVVPVAMLRLGGERIAPAVVGSGRGLQPIRRGVTRPIRELTSRSLGGVVA